VFANCSKNQNKVLKPVGCFALPNTGDFARKKSPGVGKYKNFEMHNLQSPHISLGSPPLGKQMTSALTEVWALALLWNVFMKKPLSHHNY